MRIRLDFDNIEDYIYLIEETIEEYEDYQKSITDIMNSIVDEGQGAFFKSLEAELEARIDNISKVNEYIEEIKNKLQEFLDNYRENDDSETIGEYLFDTDEAEERRQEIESFFEKINYLEDKFEDSIEYEEYQSKVRNFKNNKESDWGLRREYKEEEETADYLIRKKSEIKEYLANEKHNSRILDEIEDILRKD